MAKNRMVSTGFWSDHYISNLDPVEKLLFLYLLTGDRSTLGGIYELPAKVMAVETGIETEMVKKILARFEEDGKIKYQDGWVVIRNFLKHHEQGSPTVKKAIDTTLSAAPEWARKFIGKGIDTLSPSALASTSISANAPLEKVLVKDSEESAIKRPAKYPHAREVASWMPFVEESWFINTTELKHMELLFKRGKTTVLSLIRFIAAHKDDPYCPKFTKPSDLERKWRDYQDYADKND